MTAILAMIWGAITSKLAGPVGLAASVALGIALAVAHVQGAVYRHDAKVAQASAATAAVNLASANMSLKNETTALDAQGAAVAALKAESAARSVEAAKAVHAAQAVTATLTKREATIAALKPMADLCASADAALLEGVK